MKRQLAYLCLAWIGLAATAIAEPCAQCAVRCTDVTVSDGDTVKCTLVLGFGVSLPNRTIRAAGYDAYEISRARRTVLVTDAEIALGRLARNDLVKLISTGSLYAVDTGKRDPYGRESAWLWVKAADGKWVEVKEFMRDKGHLRKAGGS